MRKYEKKSFFAENTVAEIKDKKSKIIYNGKSLTDKLIDLDRPEESLILQFQVRSGKFYRGAESSAQASRKCLKYGQYLDLELPNTREELNRNRQTPLEIRANKFNQIKIPEEEVRLLGISWVPPRMINEKTPVQDIDVRTRFVPFVWLPEGVRLFTYSENKAEITIERIFDNSRRVEIDGSTIHVKVPSRTQKSPRYDGVMYHFPSEGTLERFSSVWYFATKGLTTKHEEWLDKFPDEEDERGGDTMTFYPTSIAPYIKGIAEFWKKYNMTPLEMSPFPLPSKMLAEIYTKICNNILIYDPKIKDKKDKLRKPHIDEKCILLGRAIVAKGHDATIFWDPARDGKFRDYDWQKK